MACPYFEPTHPAERPVSATGRLPLIKEFEGRCHAGSEPESVPENLRFRCCNHGYSRSDCPHFPVADSRSCLRYTTIRQTSEVLEVLVVEEADHTPVAWQTVEYRIEAGAVLQSLDVCLRAQVESFSRSYLACTSANE